MEIVEPHSSDSAYYRLCAQTKLLEVLRELDVLQEIELTLAMCKESILMQRYFFPYRRMVLEVKVPLSRTHK